MSFGDFHFEVIPVYRILHNIYGYKHMQIRRIVNSGYLPLPPFYGDTHLHKAHANGLYLLGQGRLLIRVFNTLLRDRSILHFRAYPELVDIWHNRHEALYNGFLSRAARAGQSDLEELLASHTLEELVTILAN